VYVILTFCTITQNGQNYNHQIHHRDSPSWVLAHQLILGQKVKVTWSQSANTCRRLSYQNGWICNYQTCHRDSPSWVHATHLILGQKVKGHHHRVTKCKNLLKAIKWPAWVMHYPVPRLLFVLSWRASSQNDCVEEKLHCEMVFISTCIRYIHRNNVQSFSLFFVVIKVIQYWCIQHWRQSDDVVC